MNTPTSNQTHEQPAPPASMTSIGVGCSGGLGYFLGYDGGMMGHEEPEEMWRVGDHIEWRPMRK